MVRSGVRTVLCLVLLGSLGAQAAAEEYDWIGRQAVPKSDRVRLKLGNRTVRTLGPGEAVKVAKSQGEWLWDGRGWVLAGEMVEVSNAVDFFSGEIRANPTAFGYASRGQVWVIKGKYRLALDDLNQAVRLAPRDGRMLVLRSNLWDRLGETAKALEDAEQAVRLEPRMSEAYRSRSKAWAHLGELEKAVADAGEAIRLDPGNSAAYGNRAFARLQLGDARGALRDCDEAIRLEPGNAWNYTTRATVFTEMGRLGQAIDDFTTALKLEPGNELVLLTRGTLRSEHGDYDGAMADFNEVLKLNPAHPGAYINRGNAFAAVGDYEKAIADYEEALRLDPGVALHVHGNLAKAWEQRGEYARALAEHERAVRAAPDVWFSHHALAWLLATCPEQPLRDGPRAVSEATRACELAEWKVPDCLDALAAAYAEAGDFDSAVRWQTKALELTTAGAPTRPAMQLRLADYQARRPFHTEPVAKKPAAPNQHDVASPAKP